MYARKMFIRLLTGQRQVRLGNIPIHTSRPKNHAWHQNIKSINVKYYNKVSFRRFGLYKNTKHKIVIL